MPFYLLVFSSTAVPINCHFVKFPLQQFAILSTWHLLTCYCHLFILKTFSLLEFFLHAVSHHCLWLNLTLCQLAICSTHHFCQLNILSIFHLSPRHFVNLSFHQNDISSTCTCSSIHCHFVNLALRQLVILSTIFGSINHLKWKITLIFELTYPSP